MTSFATDYKDAVLEQDARREKAAQGAQLGRSPLADYENALQAAGQRYGTQEKPRGQTLYEMTPRQQSTTQPVPGYTYDAGTDYQAQINDAIARGDYYAAALAEQQRNAKIYGEGLSASQTQNYASYLPGGSNYARGQLAQLENGGAGMTTEQLQQLYLNIAANGGGGATSQADYINSMYDAAVARQQERLMQDYAEQQAGFTRLEQEADRSYQENLAQAIGDTARTRRSFAETANAYGLSSGAAGQSALSMANQETKNFAAIRAARQQAQQELALQRETAKTQYESAIREALASNDFERAQALYNEAVRVDESLRQQGQYTSNAIMNYLGTMMGYNRDDAQQDYDRQLNAAEYAAALGDYSLLGKLYGWSQEQINRYNNLWALQNPTSGSSGGSGSSGRSGSGGGGSYSSNSSPATDDSASKADVPAEIRQQINMNRSNAGRAYTINQLLQAGTITQAQADALAKEYGY